MMRHRSLIGPTLLRAGSLAILGRDSGRRAKNNGLTSRVIIILLLVLFRHAIAPETQPPALDRPPIASRTFADPA